MDERLFSRLAALLASEAVVLATVRATRGATPRKRGSRMLVTREASEFSVGGGAAEATVIGAARALLQEKESDREIEIDLSGRPGAAGVCGGQMQLALRRWQGDEDRARAEELAAVLRSGRRVALVASALDAALDAASPAEFLHPNPRLLIVGAGHCGVALYDLARYLAFDLWVFDERATCFAPTPFPAATCAHGDYAQLALAFDSEREVYAVLLNRDFPSDVATLRELAGRPLAFLGMMGSRKRIGEVLAALPEHRDALALLHAPVGLDLGAQTPHEIAVSILAQLVQVRAERVSNA